MERMASPLVNFPLSAQYLAGYTNVINAITSAGAFAVLDAHNYGRYNGQIITDATAFGAFWTNMANAFKANSKVIFDINNEYNTISQDIVLQMNQAGISAIRAAGATQTIFAEGNGWTGTTTWASLNDNMKTLHDPLNNLVYEMHQYHDDGSGSTGACASTTIGIERVQSATAWLRANGKQGIIGETAGGNNPTCLAAVTGLLDHLKANSDVWTGVTWWSAGAGWAADYYASFEPPSGQAYVYYNSLLKSYKRGRPTVGEAVSSTTKQSSVSPATATPATNGPTYRHFGRVNPATGELTWPGSGITFSFTGTSASVPIKSITGSSSAQIVVNGGAPTIISDVAGSAFTVGPLSSGPHTVEIRKRSETVIGTIFIGLPTTSGQFTPVAQPKKRVESIGDSISVGYGLDGVNPCTNTAAVEDAPKTYGAIAAAAIGADYSIVAWSGKGVTRNIATGAVDTSPLMPELWTRYGANDADNSCDFSTPVDYVVINLGTNDFSYLGFDASGTAYNARPELDSATYTAGLVKLAKSALGKYPKAQVFLTTSPMLSDFYPTAAEAEKTKQTAAVKAAVAQMGAAAHFVDFPTQSADVGCDYHPNAATQASMGAILAAAFQSI